MRGQWPPDEGDGADLVRKEKTLEAKRPAFGSSPSVEADEAEPPFKVAPGKRTLTMRLARRALSVGRAPIQARPSRSPAPQPEASAPAQRRAAPYIGAFIPTVAELRGDSSTETPAERGTTVRARAAEGVAGAGATLPHLDAIQVAFGRHDVANIRAHVGSEAAEAAADIGAEAYATGNRIAFARHPDLHTAAHEAAHVVQQRAGIHLEHGVGAIGDAYERHADAVADLVVQGRSAEALLDQVAGSPRSNAASDRAVQRKPDRAAAPDKVGAQRARPDRRGPHEGQAVAVIGPGSPADTEHVYRAGATLGEATSESEAIAAVKVAGRGAVFAGEGVFFAYRLIGPVGPKPAIVADRGLRVEEGVIAVIVGAAVYRPGHHATETTPETSRAYGDPFAPYRDLRRERGGLRNLDRGELFGVFDAAMRDNALAILGESQRQAQAKRAQFSRGPAGTRPAEQDVIEGTANQALAVQRQIEVIDDRRKRLNFSRRVSGNRSTEDVSHKMLAELDEQRRPLAQQRREIDLQYPMIGRYRSAESLQRFLARSQPERIQALASDATSVLDNIRETRSHLLAGRINLWAVPGVVDSTIAGLGFAKGSPQRAWIEEEAAARARREKIADLVLAAFSIGLGLAAAFTTGGLSLALTAGAVGLGAYDAIQVTEDHDIKSAATDTDIDPNHSLLPEDMRVHWGWLVVAWAGLGLDAFDVARAITHAGKASKTADVVEQAARALARQDQALLARLRKAAGNIDLGDLVSDANRQELSRLVGAPITIETAPVASVRIRYDVDGKGRTFVIGSDVGSQAKAGDILAHVDTVRLLQRRSNLVERLDDLWTRIRTFGQKGAGPRDNPFPPRSAGFDSWHELHKLKDLTRIKRAQLDELLARGADAPALQAELRKQLAFLGNDLDIHARVVDSLAAQKGGRGFIAMSDDTRAALEQGKRLPDFPDKGADDLTEADLKASAFYYVRKDDGSFELATKADRAEVQPARADGSDAGGIRIPGAVQSRINVSGRAWDHIVKRHFSGKPNASQFTVTQEELHRLLQSENVRRTPVTRILESSEGPRYVRDYDAGRPIGVDKFANNTPTQVICVLTDRHGTLVTASPGVIK